MRNQFKTDLFSFCLEIAKADDPDLIEATKKLAAIIKHEYEVRKPGLLENLIDDWIGPTWDESDKSKFKEDILSIFEGG